MMGCIARRFRRTCTWYATCAFATLQVLAGTAGALTQPRDELWAFDPFTPTYWHVFVRFQADVSAGDANGSSGVRFAIAQRHGANVPNPLLSYVIDAPSLPPIGSPVIVSVDASWNCDSAGRGVVSPQDFFVTWCDAGSRQRTIQGDGVGRGQVGNLDPAMPFDLVVLDESGVPGGTPSPENPIVCGTLQIPSTHAHSSSHIFDELESLPGAAAILGPPRKGLRGGLTPAQAASVNPGTLELSFEPASLRCGGPAPLNAPVQLYVLMRSGDVTECGIAGAEFRVDGIPSQWVSFAQPSQPNAIAIGNPVEDGTTCGFLCAGGGGGLVPVYELLLAPTTFEQDLVLQITSHRLPKNPYFECPLVATCDVPVFSLWCVSGGRAVLNPRTVSCTSAVQPVTWSQIKELYEDPGQRRR